MACYQRTRRPVTPRIVVHIFVPCVHFQQSSRARLGWRPAQHETLDTLQAAFEKRFSYGGAVLANYSWAKLISNTEGVSPYLELDTSGAGAIQDYTNLRAVRSLADFTLMCPTGLY
jgi:hypothetical protein